jgi:aminopeptidase N
MEDAAGGENLAPFFGQWLTQGGFPVLDVSWSYAEDGTLSIDVAQAQTDGFAFALPVEFLIETDGAESLLERSISLADSPSTITRVLASRPTRIIVDPETKLLARWTVSERN